MSIYVKMFIDLKITKSMKIKHYHIKSTLHLSHHLAQRILLLDSINIANSNSNNSMNSVRNRNSDGGNMSSNMNIDSQRIPSESTKNINHPMVPSKWSPDCWMELIENFWRTGPEIDLKRSCSLLVF